MEMNAMEQMLEYVKKALSPDNAINDRYADSNARYVLEIKLAECGSARGTNGGKSG
jgi:hypothetical protein